MIRFLRTAACRGSNRLPLFAILVAIWAANGSPGVGAPVQRNEARLVSEGSGGGQGVRHPGVVLRHQPEAFAQALAAFAG